MVFFSHKCWAMTLYRKVKSLYFPHGKQKRKKIICNKLEIRIQDRTSFVAMVAIVNMCIYKRIIQQSPVLAADDD